jgi:Ricin-type beta-trefoil lectin domain
MRSTQPTGKHRRRRCRRAARLLPALLAVGAALVLSATWTSSASAAPAAAVQQSKFVAVPVAAPHGTTGTGAKPAAASVWFELVLKANGARYCLDANDAGPSAGRSGDKVQLWQCNGTKNQYWEQYPPSTGIQPTGPFLELRNELYPHECLNAREPIENGSPTQLWACNSGANELWSYSTGNNALLSDWGIANDFDYVLDARAPGIGNGDAVQIWTSTGGANQMWWVRRP